jgi:hypothetical protein
MKRIALAFLLLAEAAPLSVAAQSPPALTDGQRQKAAEQFASALAEEGSEDYIRAFRLALEAAYDLDNGKASGPARQLPSPARGNIEADPRYRAHLDAVRKDTGAKIWGGRPVALGSYPDVVAVLGSGYLCTGTLIGPKVVLTAAHCQCGGVNERVVIGDDTGSSSTINVDHGESQIACDRPLREGDLALLFLSREAPVTPRRLALAAWITDASSIHIVGFGQTEDQREPPGKKREVDVVIASPACSGSVANAQGSVPDPTYYDCTAGREMVAGKPMLNRDSCFGDSGGPAFVRGPDGTLYLGAATSRGIERADRRPCGDGGIYTRVDGAALEWIQRRVPGVGVGPQVASAPAATSGLAAVLDSAALSIAEPVPVVAAAAAAPTAPVPPVQPVPDPGQAAALQRFLRSAGRQQVKGTVAKDPTGSLVLTPTVAPDVRIPVADPRSVEGLVGLPVTAQVQKVASAGVRALDLQLGPVGEWLRRSSVLPAKRFPDLNRAVDALREQASAITSSNPSEVKQAQEALLPKSEQLERELVLAYGALPPGKTPQRDALVHQFRSVRDTTKAIYGRLDIYRPEAYKRIFENSRGSVALAVIGNPEPYCSGFLMGRDLVLTAAHCLDTFLPREIEVRVNYETALTGAPLPVDTYAIDRVLAQGTPAYSPDGPRLDFALLQLFPRDDGKRAGELWPPQCLSTQRVRYESALYVIGHPRGNPRVVHDNAFVYFPFQATLFEFNQLKLTVEAELADDPNRQQRMDQFFASYRERKPPPETGRLFENYSLRWGGEPTIGADSDTYHGDSGSPVFSRQSHLVVGLFFAGESDLDVPFTPGWRAHEAILPITEVIAQLDENLPSWRTFDGVCVKR